MYAKRLARPGTLVCDSLASHDGAVAAAAAAASNTRSVIYSAHTVHTATLSTSHLEERVEEGPFFIPRSRPRAVSFSNFLLFFMRGDNYVCINVSPARFPALCFAPGGPCTFNWATTILTIEVASPLQCPRCAQLHILLYLFCPFPRYLLIHSSSRRLGRNKIKKYLVVEVTYLINDNYSA